MLKTLIYNKVFINKNFFREEGVGGSNPLTPTNISSFKQYLVPTAAELLRGKNFLGNKWVTNNQNTLPSEEMVRRLFIHCQLLVGGAGRHGPHRGYIGLVGLDGVLKV